MEPDLLELPTVELHRNLRTIEVLTEAQAKQVVNHLQQLEKDPEAWNLIETGQQSCTLFNMLPIDLDEMVATGLSNALKQYASEVPEFPIAAVRDAELLDENYLPFRFDKGQYHTLMTENATSGLNTGGRLLVIHIWLNDSFRGGELCIYPNEVRHEPQVGHAVIFPATWEYSYYTKAVESGSKYCLYTFIRRLVRAEDNDGNNPENSE